VVPQGHPLWPAERVFTSVAVSREAVQAAYEMAGIGPEDIDVAEVHDCFTIAEIVAYRRLVDLRGQVKEED